MVKPHGINRILDYDKMFRQIKNKLLSLKKILCQFWKKQQMIINIQLNKICNFLRLIYIFPPDFIVIKKYKKNLFLLDYIIYLF